ncbi:MAG: MFS transporter [Bacteroidota bacterium]
MNKNVRLIAQILVTSLFFLWAIAHNLNDVLIKQFQKALELSRGQAGFIQFAFYLGYFLMALPAGLVIKKYGYKRGILFGLLLYAVGALLFLPAAELQAYGFFLFALFIIASGLTFLETAANPYITLLGDTESSEQRLNFAQAFNGLGAVVGPVIGGAFILSGIEYTDQQLASMSAEQLTEYRTMEAHSVQVPYLIVALVVLMFAFLIFRSKMPEFVAEKDEAFRWTIFKRRHFVWGRGRTVLLCRCAGRDLELLY